LFKNKAMPFHQPDSIRFLTFDSFEGAGIIHAVFTRQGGVSPQPWASLNVGGLLGDDPERVKMNRVISFQALGKASESVYDVWQVHGTEVICTDAPRLASNPHLKADAIFTDRPDVTLFMRFADCVPILLYDPIRRVVGVVHAGWLGTVKGAVTKAVEAIEARYGSEPANILAAIGPSICCEHYAVGEEVVHQVQTAFGEQMPQLTPVFSGRHHFDLWQANRLLLEQAGVRQIELAGICTACNPQDWYSHRGEKGRTGRFGVLIALQP
jgi:polyphenol oxidase